MKLFRVGILIVVQAFVSCSALTVRATKNYPQFQNTKNPVPIVTYYDGTQIVRSVYVEFYEESHYIEFYSNGQIKQNSMIRYIDNFDDFIYLPLNRYHAFSYYVQDHENGLTGYRTPFYGDTYYSNGKLKSKLFADGDNVHKVIMKEYHENGILASEKFFLHKKIGIFFEPIGTWMDYDSTGRMISEYDAPKAFLPATD